MVNLPTLIAEKLYGFFNDLTTAVEDVWDAIKGLPDLILNGIKSIFIPDVEEIEMKFTAFLDELSSRFGFDTSFWDSLFDSESAVQDVYVDYNFFGLGNMRLKVFDASALHKAVEVFRPIIRGFIVLLLAFYNVKAVLGFVRQDAGVMAGKTEGGNE